MAGSFLGPSIFDRLLL
uniref:Uncharacterized protein n=1 Tax=Rhizophora mucronata TaxID=61149 RepID=A0A2P2PU61_RHIMU